ncbi:YbjQ family protein [uncultured Brachyspira sp.]|uniref:YbjQ family protein n=1 Tax=uncultured Brachyspira sp. TaxID=221953 RepID=UPI00261BCDAB|nr:YbjQ family protein [uncultured Brachyspira sp.]
MSSDIKLFTVNYLPSNYNYELLGLVKGNIAQSKHIGKDLLAGLKNIVGGEVESYTEMINEAREIATKRMIEEAKKLGANAIIGINYSSSSVMEGTTEVIAYGTAVIIK